VFDKPAEQIRGDIQKGLSEAEINIDEIYRTPTEHHNPWSHTRQRSLERLTS